MKMQVGRDRWQEENQILGILDTGYFAEQVRNAGFAK